MRGTPFLLAIVASALTLTAGSALAGVARTAASPSNTSLPAISGSTHAGQTLTASSGSWDGTTPITYVYSWERCNSSGSGCAAIGGATSQNYVVSTSSVGRTIRVEVTATNTDGTNQALSAATATIAAATSNSPVNTALPLISGTTSVGQTLQASTGTWTGLGTSGFAYQWTRCNLDGTSCASISGATGQSYGIGQVDLGNAVRVNVTATNSSGATSASSAASLIAVKTVQIAGFNAVLRTGQEVGGTNATKRGAAGHFTAKLTGNSLHWTLTFAYLTGRPTVIGLNRGVRGSNGIAFKTLCRNCYSPHQGTLTLTASQAAAMRAGATYVNIHTLRNKSGEIRGQINRVS